MKIKMSVDLVRDGEVIIQMYERKLLDTCQEGSNAHADNMREFRQMLQEVADKSLRLGITYGIANENLGLEESH